MSSEMSIKCTICDKEGTTYNYYGFNLCPKCNGCFRDAHIPKHIPEEQWYSYKLLLARKKFNEN
jgi:uncharacterized CHY-type Zn-finger protein